MNFKPAPGAISQRFARIPIDTAHHAIVASHEQVEVLVVRPKRCDLSTRGSFFVSRSQTSLRHGSRRRSSTDCTHDAIAVGRKKIEMVFATAGHRYLSTRFKFRVGANREPSRTVPTGVVIPVRAMHDAKAICDGKRSK